MKSVHPYLNFNGNTEEAFDFYKSVEVKTGGYPAEFGRSTGGFVNAITKSGTNVFHGGVTATWEPGGMRRPKVTTKFDEAKA